MLQLCSHCRYGADNNAYLIERKLITKKTSASKLRHEHIANKATTERKQGQSLQNAMGVGASSWSTVVPPPSARMVCALRCPHRWLLK